MSSEQWTLRPSSAPTSVLAQQALRVIVMGFRIPSGVRVTAPSKLPLANIDEVKQEVVAGHPPTTLYQLLMGDTQSKRDKLAAARVLTSCL
jgi:hypothetical protein